MGWWFLGFFFQADEAAMIVKAGYAEPGRILNLGEEYGRVSLSVLKFLDMFGYSSFDQVVSEIDDEGRILDEFPASADG